MLSPVVYSVGQVANYLKEKLESDGLLSRLTVQGEVANLRTVASGHSYFSLREDGSTIRCVMFRGRSGIPRGRTGGSGRRQLHVLRALR